MEIKKGDKVRVSKDAPKVYLSGMNNLFKYHVCKVQEVDGDSAIIRYTDIGIDRWLAIPIKHLVKVDAEAKEPKIKKGDKVRYIGNDQPEYRGSLFIIDGDVFFNDYFNQWQASSIKIKTTDTWGICNVPLSDLKHYVEPGCNIGDKVIVHYPSGDRIGRIQEVMFDGTYDIDFGGGCTGHNITRSQTEPYTAPKIKVGDRVRNKSYAIEAVVLGIDSDYIAVRRDDGIKQEWKISTTELVEPTEQTEAEEDARIRQMEAELDRILHPEKYYTYEARIDNVTMNWQRYEADLAKEVALKVANKFNTPHEAAEYAVSVAKAVVEGLKRK